MIESSTINDQLIDVFTTVAKPITKRAHFFAHDSVRPICLNLCISAEHCAENYNWDKKQVHRKGTGPHYLHKVNAMLAIISI